MNALRRMPPLETVLVAVAVIVLSVLAVTRQTQQPPAAVDSYSSYDSASGGYRAWYELMQREGVRVGRFERRLTALDGELAVLVWADPLPSDTDDGGASPLELDALEHWVNVGGRLVYLGHDDVAAKGGLLSLPVSTGKRHDVVAPVWAPALRERGIAAADWSKALPRLARKRGATILARDGFGVLAMRYAYGRGAVTIVVDEGLFSNGRMTHRDDARFAYLLAVPAANAAMLAFDESPHGHLVPDHWWQIVPKPFLIGVIVACLALTLAFAGAAIRLGPALPPPHGRDPTSAEFVDSVAALLQRGGGARQALDDAVRAARRTLARALGVEESDERGIVARLATPQQRGDFAELLDLARAPGAGDPTLVRAVALAQRLRKDYARDGFQRR